MAGQIDFWTEGALSELRAKVRAELQRLGSPESLTLDELKHSISRSDEWRTACLSLTERAKEALIASQLRNNIGQSIEAALEQAGWDVVDSTFEAEDFRKSVHVKLKNLQGDEIVTIISPVHGAGNTIQNKLNISFFDRSTNDETFRKTRLKAITGMLQEDGLECTEPQCQPGTENQPAQQQEKLNFDKVRGQA